MGAGSSRGYQDGLITKKELERVRRRFQRLSEGAKGLSLADFRQPPLSLDNPLFPLIFSLYDTNRDGLLDEAEFEAALAALGRLQSQEDRTSFAFRVYNTSGSGYLSEGELSSLLRTLAGQALGEAQLEAIAHATMREFDVDGDGALSPAEFCALACAGDAEGSGPAVL